MSEMQRRPLVVKDEQGITRLTDKGRERIDPWVTDSESDVYAFTREADPQAVAAAMARLSRSSNDTRAILAGEFLGEKDGMEINLLRRVVNQFGDDSVMQLYPMQVVFEDVSNLATKEIEWGRFAAYLEQSTRYLRFDKKDEEGRYAYYTPDEFDLEISAEYQRYMDKIFDIYSDSYQKLLAHIQATSTTPEGERDAAWRRACHAQACDGVRSLLPAATKATVGMVGNAQSFHNMILHMESHELPEVRQLGRKALQAVRQVAPVFFERTDRPDRGLLISNHRRETREATRELTASLLEGFEEEIPKEPGVRLVSVDGSEDELVAKILADSSEHSFATVQKAVACLTERRKAQVIGIYVGARYNRRAKPGRALELPHYLFEVECDYGAFRDIQRHRVVDGLEWQPLRPTGFVTPDIISEAGLKENYDQAFALSAELYERLREKGYEAQAQYATLFGHIMRFTAKINARSLTHTAELRTSPQGHPSYREVYKAMHEQIAAVHPRIAEAMQFVNTDEDEELARLGAERQAQVRYGEGE